MNYLIVDDHPLVFNALKTELGRAHRYLVAGSLEESLVRIDEHPDIDLVIYDLHLPDSRGLQGLTRLRTAAPSLPVIVLSACADNETIEKAWKLGISGFVPKTTAMGGLRKAVELVLAGGTYMPPRITAAPVSRRRRTEALTPREEEILLLLMRGLPNKRIATTLGITTNTVRVHVARILKKTGLHNRTQLVSEFFLQ